MNQIQFKEIHVFFAEKQALVFNEPIEIVKNNVEIQLNSNPNDIKCQLTLVQILHYYFNDYKSALKIIKDVLKQDPKSIDARLDLVDIILYHQIGSQTYCENLLMECIEIDSNYWRIYFIQMKLYDKQLKSNLFMINKMMDSLEQFPNNIWLTTYYWQILTDIDKRRQDIDLNIIIQSEYLDFEMLRRLAYILKNLDDLKFAALCEGFCLKLNPNSFYCLNNYGFSQSYLNGDQAESIELYLKAVKNNPRYATGLKNLGITYQIINKYAESTVYFKKFIEVQKNSAYGHKQIILNCYEEQDYQNGVYYCLKSLKQFPRDFELNVSYLDMIVQFNMQDIKDSEEYEMISFAALKYALSDRENNPDIQFINGNLSYIYSQINN